jgi:serine/threonine protein kinase
MRNTLINRRYRIERRISVSSESEVFLGFDSVLHRAMAIKIPNQRLLRDNHYSEALLGRYQIAAALHHRNIVATLDIGEDNGSPYAIMEYFAGDSLAEIIHRESPFDVDDVTILVEQVADGLHYAHQRGFVHGDLSTSDIIVDDRGMAKITGFGAVARSVVNPAGADITGHDMRCPPESTVAADIQALGAVAFEMLTGEPPGGQDDDAKVATQASFFNPDVPGKASDILATALFGVPGYRFDSVASFSRALSKWRTTDLSEFAQAVDTQPTEAPISSSFLEAAASPAQPVAKGPALDPSPDRSASVHEPIAARASADRAHRPVGWLLALAFVIGVLTCAIVYSSTESNVPTAAEDVPVELERLLRYART